MQLTPTMQLFIDPLIQAALNSLLLLSSGLVTLLIGIVVRFGMNQVRLLHAKLGDAQFGLLQSFVEIAVKEQHQIGLDKIGAQKLQDAITAVAGFAQTHHIPVTEDQIRTFIESALNDGVQLSQKTVGEQPTSIPGRTLIDPRVLADLKPISVSSDDLVLRTSDLPK